MDIFSLKGKTAIVIGGSKGLCKGIATGFSQAGADVVLVSRKQNELDAAAIDISNKTGGVVKGISADITSVEGCKELVNKVAGEFGHIDILLNGAGLNIRKPVIEYLEEDWDKVIDVQLKYVFFMGQAVAKHMIEKNIKGKIINICSLNSELGLKNMVAYVAAKGGIKQMTKAMAHELAQYGISVNAIGPGYFETEMTKPIFENPDNIRRFKERIPFGRTGFPEDLIGTAVFLASTASDYIVGQTIYVDGGYLIN
ncbi:SDR family oxidoreductase [Sedimentibacter sp.]|uniref:SDR family oxidoreductase n=1 Tax=Sedimentibacter sp. TaxID=1960295 RepID=UPI000EE143A7|nr:SDR family oxidoreductase [Sedimentibacter sp.]HCX61546.1 2-deoxy-D-gluconate 3-dehydrogenase [Clostridiales bacterium]